MKVEVIKVGGIDEALYGLGLSFGATSKMSIQEFISDKSDGSVYSQMFKRAGINAPMDGGHNKFLESIEVWLKIDAPRFIWQELDTYRVGVTKQSDSTMHTLLKKKNVDAKLMSSVQIFDINSAMQPMTEQGSEQYNQGIALLSNMFSIYEELLELMKIAELPEHYKLQFVKSGLPEVFHNCRVFKTNYKSLKNIVEQRKNHRLWQWHELVRVIDTLPHSNWINPPKKEWRVPLESDIGKFVWVPVDEYFECLVRGKLSKTVYELEIANCNKPVRQMYIVSDNQSAIPISMDFMNLY